MLEGVRAGSVELDAVGPVGAGDARRGEPIGEPDPRSGRGCAGVAQFGEDLQFRPAQRIVGVLQVLEHQGVIVSVQDDVGGAVRPMSSGSVNAEWTGPRRAAITTSRTFDSRSASAWSAISVRQVVRIGGEDAGHVEGDVAVPDDHDTLVVQAHRQARIVGCPLYQATTSVAVATPGSSGPRPPADGRWARPPRTAPRDGAPADRRAKDAVPLRC